MERTQRLSQLYGFGKTVAPSVSCHACHYCIGQFCLLPLIVPCHSQTIAVRENIKPQALSFLELTRNFSTAYLASRAKANTPAASGAAADVPE